MTMPATIFGIERKERTMRAIPRNGMYAVLGVLAVVLLLAIPASGVWAAGADVCDPTNLTTGVLDGVDANADPDNDGLNNQQECRGLVPTGTSANAYISFTGWNSGNTNTERKTYLDPSAQDLFVVIVPTGTADSPSRFDKITNSTTPARGGNLVEMVNPGTIGITTHEISATASTDSRTVSTINIQGTKQKALRVTESRNTNMGTTKNPTPFGSANWGTPNGLDDATVYTYRIEKHVNDTCGAKECKDGITTGITAKENVINQYVKSVAAHEMGHMFKLTANSDAAFNGNHYDPASKVVMSQNITWVKNGNTQVIYYIPNGNAPNGYVTPSDVDNKRLNGL